MLLKELLNISKIDEALSPKIQKMVQIAIKKPYEWLFDSEGEAANFWESDPEDQAQLIDWSLNSFVEKYHLQNEKTFIIKNKKQFIYAIIKSLNGND